MADLQVWVEVGVDEFVDFKKIKQWCDEVLEKVQQDDIGTAESFALTYRYELTQVIVKEIGELTLSYDRRHIKVSLQETPKYGVVVE